MRSLIKTVALAAVAAGIAGCTVHPRGEFAERAVALDAGKPYVQPFEERTLPALPADATPDQLVAYALLNNADLERLYWQWRSALEQAPREGTQKTGLMITLNGMISNGTTAAALNALGVGNDAANALVLPGKLETAAQAALAQARAAGRRFDQARFDLRSRVLSACADYALTAERVRLEQANADLLGFMAKATELRLGTGDARPQDLLKANIELELSHNEIAVQQAKLPGQRAAINALLNRAPAAPLAAPPMPPAPRPLIGDDAQILREAAGRNPELQALALEISGQRAALARAKLEYQPEFNVALSTDLAGVAQSLMGSVMLPVLRYQAIAAGIRQAEANLRAADALRRQAGRDLAARLAADLALLHDLDRQIALVEGVVLPRAQRVLQTMRNSYAVGQDSLLDVLDAQRSLLALRRMLAESKTTREQQLADLEAAAAMGLAKTAEGP